jgi:hypothetical protein
MRLRAPLVVTLAFAVFAAVIVSAQTGPAKKDAAPSASAKKAIEVYREYQAALKGATTLTPILPFLTKEYATNLQGAPKDMQDRMLKRFLDDAAWRDIAVTKETTKGDILELETTAKNADGRPYKGTIAFKNEGNAWKLEGQGWLPEMAKKD